MHYDAKRIKAQIRALGVSQQELSRRAKVSQSTVSRAQGGKPLRHGAARKKLIVYLEAAERERLSRAPSDDLLVVYGQVMARSKPLAGAVLKILSALARR